MKKRYRSCSVLACVFAIWFTAGPSAFPARANSIYTYTGNAFNEFPDAGVGCPPVCNVMGSFTVAQALAPDLSLTTITPLSFSVTSGGVTLTDGVPADTSLDVSTDASGAIVNWSWVVSGPANAPIARILTENIPGVVADDVRLSSYGVVPPPLYGRRVGQVSNDPGTWTTTPEPASFMLLGGGLVGIVAAVRRKRIV
jgi:hypothetical protein